MRQTDVFDRVAGSQEPYNIGAIVRSVTDGENEHVRNILRVRMCRVNDAGN